MSQDVTGWFQLCHIIQVFFSSFITTPATLSYVQVQLHLPQLLLHPLLILPKLLLYLLCVPPLACDAKRPVYQAPLATVFALVSPSAQLG